MPPVERKGLSSLLPRFILAFVTTVASICIDVPSVEAQNLISNGDFATDLGDWPTYTSSPSATVVWTGNNGSPDFGAAELQTMGPGQEVGFMRCLPLPPVSRANHAFRYWSIPADALRFEISFHDNPDCMWPALGAVYSDEGENEILNDGWTVHRVVLNVPAGTTHANLWFGLPAYLGSALLARLDTVTLVDRSELFVDGFESP